MPKTYQDWQTQATNPKLPNVIGLGGDERIFVEEALEHIKSRCLSGGLVDFNFEQLSAKSVTPEQIWASASMLPVMADCRLVIVTEADAIKEEIPEKLNPSTVLLFIFDQLDARSKFQKSIDKTLFKFDFPKERELPGIIRTRAKKHGLKLSDDAVNLLVMETGSSLMMLERAFEKLALIANDQIITPQIIEEQVAQTAFRDAFALSRAVILKDRAGAAKALAELKAAQEVPLRLLGVLAWQFRVVLKARLFLDEKRSASEIGSKLSLFGDRLDTVMKAARLLDTASQVKRLTSLAELDRTLKSSRAPAWLIFDEAVLKWV